MQNSWLFERPETLSLTWFYFFTHCALLEEKIARNQYLSFQLFLLPWKRWVWGSSEEEGTEVEWSLPPALFFLGFPLQFPMSLSPQS